MTELYDSADPSIDTTVTVNPDRPTSIPALSSRTGICPSRVLPLLTLIHAAWAGAAEMTTLGETEIIDAGQQVVLTDDDWGQAYEQGVRIEGELVVQTSAFATSITLSGNGSLLLEGYAELAGDDAGGSVKSFVVEENASSKLDLFGFTVAQLGVAQGEIKGRLDVDIHGIPLEDSVDIVDATPKGILAVQKISFGDNGELHVNIGSGGGFYYGYDLLQAISLSSPGYESGVSHYGGLLVVGEDLYLDERLFITVGDDKTGAGANVNLYVASGGVLRFESPNGNTALDADASSSDGTPKLVAGEGTTIVFEVGASLYLDTEEKLSEVDLSFLDLSAATVEGLSNLRIVTSGGLEEGRAYWLDDGTIGVTSEGLRFGGRFGTVLEKLWGENSALTPRFYRTLFDKTTAAAASQTVSFAAATPLALGTTRRMTASTVEAGRSMQRRALEAFRSTESAFSLEGLLERTAASMGLTMKTEKDVKETSSSPEKEDLILKSIPLEIAVLSVKEKGTARMTDGFKNKFETDETEVRLGLTAGSGKWRSGIIGSYVSVDVKPDNKGSGVNPPVKGESAMTSAAIWAARALERGIMTVDLTWTKASDDLEGALNNGFVRTENLKRTLWSLGVGYVLPTWVEGASSADMFLNARILYQPESDYATRYDDETILKTTEEKRVTGAFSAGFAASGSCDVGRIFADYENDWISMPKKLMGSVYAGGTLFAGDKDVTLRQSIPGVNAAVGSASVEQVGSWLVEAGVRGSIVFAESEVGFELFASRSSTEIKRFGGIVTATMRF